MRSVMYFYIAKPTRVQIVELLGRLANSDISLSHLGKSDPPRKFAGNVDEAIDWILSDKDLTAHTFARDRAAKLEFDFQIHHDPRWTHSTLGASCPSDAVLSTFAEIALATLEVLLAVQGVIGRGKEQPWHVLHAAADCPKELRSKFVGS